MKAIILAALAAMTIAPAAMAKPATGWTFKERPTEEIGCRMSAPATAQEGVIKEALVVTYAEGFLHLTFKGARDAFIIFDPNQTPFEISGSRTRTGFVSEIAVGRELAVLKDLQRAKSIFSLNGTAYFVDITPEGRDALGKMRKCIKGQMG